MNRNYKTLIGLGVGALIELTGGLIANDYTLKARNEASKPEVRKYLDTIREADELQLRVNNIDLTRKTVCGPQRPSSRNLNPDCEYLFDTQDKIKILTDKSIRQSLTPEVADYVRYDQFSKLGSLGKLLGLGIAGLSLIRRFRK